MAKQEKKDGNNGEKRRRRESQVVTKESFCATCALFCLLALLMLCTRSLVFGSLGQAVHAFLTGLLGYCAYPLFLGGLYLSVMGLIGKRLVKNRRAGWCIGVTLVFVALIVHTATTFRWSLDGYLSRCFESGNALRTVTPAGWLGGLAVFGVAKIATQLGTLIFFILIAIFCIYLTVLAFKKGATVEEKQIKPKKEKKKKKTVEPQAPIQPAIQNLPNAQMNKQPQAQAEYAPTMVRETAPQPSVRQPMSPYFPTPQGNVTEYTPNSGYAMPSVSQRPGVTLPDSSAQEGDKNGAFSPFGAVNNGRQAPSAGNSYENSKEFLFSGNPAENFRKNLLFDPNANVNRRPPVEPSSALGGTSGYTPSYTQAYQNSINERGNDSRSINVVSESTQTPSYDAYRSNERFNDSAASVQPMSTFETPTLREEEPSYPTFEERGRDTENNDIPTPTAREELPRGNEEGYRRHDYMDLFSPSNPNIFGRTDEEETRETPSFDRNERSEMDERTTAFEDTSDRRERDGLNLLDDDDEEEDDAYSLRSGLEEQDRSRDDFSDRGERFDTPRMGFGSDEPTREEPRDVFPERDRGRDTDFTPVQPIAPMEEPKPTPPPKPRVIRPYVRVRLDDLDCRDIEPTANHEEVEETKATIISTLEDFKVTGASIASVTFGPTVTRYNVTIPRNISPKKVVALDQSIAISLHSSGVNVYPNYEDGVVSIEVPNKERQFVQLGCMLSGDTFVNAKSSSLMFAMGKDVANRKIYGDISKMIHLLVAGSSGSGKSVFLGSLIISLIYKYSPEELRLILIDPKKTEFVLYNDLPHLMINEIITDVNKAVQSLNWAIGEMNRRYGLFEQMSRAGTYVVNLDQYNAQLDKNNRLPKIVIIIDELADLMLAAKKEMEDRIQNLTQKARAAGIHLIVATQRPSTDVITGVIKSNLPTRVAFYVATDVDSRVILDQTGAQKLLGKGDFLYTMPGIVAPVRVQSAFISTEESQKVVNFIKNNNEAYYDEEATAYINSRGGYAGDGSPSGGGGNGDVDPMYIEALRYVILSGSASISMIQRKCSAGYNRAGKIVEWMEDMGYISPFDGAKARKVLITKEEFESKYGPIQ